MIRLSEIDIPPFLRRFILFCGVGVFNTIVGFSLIMFFYKVVGLYYMLANFLGYILAVAFGYVMHRNITFRDRKTPTEEWREIVKNFRKFSAVFTVCYLVQLLALYVLVDVWHFWVVPSQILAMGLYVLCSFAGMQVFAFKETENKAG